MSLSKIKEPAQKKIWNSRIIPNTLLYEQSILSNSSEIRARAFNSLFELSNQIRPDYNDLLDEETKQELLSLEEEIQKWHKEG